MRAAGVEGAIGEYGATALTEGGDMANDENDAMGQRRKLKSKAKNESRTSCHNSGA